MNTSIAVAAPTVRTAMNDACEGQMSMVRLTDVRAHRQELPITKRRRPDSNRGTPSSRSEVLDRCFTHHLPRGADPQWPLRSARPAQPST